MFLCQHFDVLADKSWTEWRLMYRATILCFDDVGEKVLFSVFIPPEVSEKHKHHVIIAVIMFGL